MSTSPLQTLIVEPAIPADASIIWLHGLGADGHDFEPIVPELDLPATLGIRFVFPHAPRMPVTINGGFVMRAWYDIASPDLNLEVDAAGISASSHAVAALIAREREQGVSPSRIILAGFSQGGVIALETATRYQERLGGVISLSAYVAQPQHIPAATEALPIFMGHGTDDNIVAFPLGVRSKNLLESKGYAVEWRDYPMPHSVCPAEIADIRAWLLKTLAAGT